MSSKPLSPIRRAWYKWKALHLPWRKRFLVGLDLQGNTFWEFRDTLSSHRHRMRRIVHYPSSVHYSEVNVSPQWHQWLRHTRQHPPSLAEQGQDLVRQENLKVLAAQADKRWAEKSSFLDAPGRRRVFLGAGEDERNAANVKLGEGGDTGEVQVPNGPRHVIDLPHRGQGLEKHNKEDPWKKARGAPSEKWQPQAWDSTIAASKQ